MIESSMITRTPYPTDVSDEEWAFVAHIAWIEFFGRPAPYSIMVSLTGSRDLSPELQDELVAQCVLSAVLGERHCVDPPCLVSW